MNKTLVAEEVKRAVTMEQIMNAYGYHVKHGKMMCPFHGDRNASLKVYKDNNSWYCFGCGKGGSVIDFVMAQEGCGFSQAVNAICDTFGINAHVADNPLDVDNAMKCRRTIDFLTEKMLEQLDALDEYHEAEMNTITQISRRVYAKKREEMTARDYTVKLWCDDRMARIEDKAAQIREAREEVKEWRTTKYQEHLTSTKTTASSHRRKAPSA